eukprot:364741-Chlamydomonas_euryale.AAC.22
MSAWKAECEGLALAAPHSPRWGRFPRTNAIYTTGRRRKKAGAHVVHSSCCRWMRRLTSSGVSAAGMVTDWLGRTMHATANSTLEWHSNESQRF